MRVRSKQKMDSGAGFILHFSLLPLAFDFSPCNLNTFAGRRSNLDDPQVATGEVEAPPLSELKQTQQIKQPATNAAES